MKLDVSYRQLLVVLQDLHSEIMELLQLPRSQNGDARLEKLIADYEHLANAARKFFTRQKDE